MECAGTGQRVQNCIRVAKVGAYRLIYKSRICCPNWRGDAGAAIEEVVGTSARAGFADFDAGIGVRVRHNIRDRAHSHRVETVLIAGLGKEFADSETALTRRRSFRNAIPPSLHSIEPAKAR